MLPRGRLPQLSGDTFITDGGMETTLIFHDGLDLPHFASFVLLDDVPGRERLRSYYRTYIDIARDGGVGIVLDTPTWRANADWGARLGYSPEALADVNRRSVALLEELRPEAGEETPFVISGCLGPRGDGYRADERMAAAEAEQYHATQISTFARTAADLVTALTLTYSDEGIGIVRAANGVGMPIVISFTVETDGRLPSGESLESAVAAVDEQTAGGPSYFMINCAHPTHFDDVLAGSGSWLDRIRGLRANASTKSHAELDESDELDAGDPVDLARRYSELKARLPKLNVVGGCCGDRSSPCRRDLRGVLRQASAALAGPAAAHRRCLLAEGRVGERLQRLVQRRQLACDPEEMLARVESAVERVHLVGQPVEPL